MHQVVKLKDMIKLINIFIMALTIATGSGGEPQATYRIDYAGMKVWYCAMTQSGKQIAPPEQARAGEEVVIYYPMIATDTDYTFLVDGCYFRPDYRRDKGFILRFVMPDHDITIECKERNSMHPEEVPEER